MIFSHYLIIQGKEIFIRGGREVRRKKSPIDESRKKRNRKNRGKFGRKSNNRKSRGQTRKVERRGRRKESKGKILNKKRSEKINGNKNRYKTKKSKKTEMPNIKNNNRVNKNTIEKSSLTDDNVRDYRFAVNQRRKAIRIQKWIKLLDKKVDNSMTFFLDGASYFENCPEGKSIYESLR